MLVREEARVPRGRFAVALGFLLCALLAGLASARPAAADPLGSVTEVSRWHSAYELSSWTDLAITEAGTGSELVVSEFGAVEFYDLNGTFLGKVETWDTTDDFYLSALTAANTVFLSRTNSGEAEGWVRVVPLGAGEVTHFQPTVSFSPRGMALAPDGTLWVADYAGNDVATRKPDGGTGPFIGSAGVGPGQMRYPTDVAYGNNSMYVVDSGNFRIERFALDGRFLGAWGSQGTGAGQLFAPTDVAVGPDGRVFVLSTPSYGQQASIDAFTPDGTFVAKASLPIAYGLGLAVDSAGNLYANGELEFPGGKQKGVLKFRLDPPTTAPPTNPPGAAGGGKAKAKRVVKVKGKMALLTLTCPAGGACTGTAKLSATTGSKKKKGAAASAKPKPKSKRAIKLGVAKFALAAGRQGTVKVPLTKKARRLLGAAGPSGLKARLEGPGVAPRAVVLKAIARHHKRH